MPQPASMNARRPRRTLSSAADWVRCRLSAHVAIWRMRDHQKLHQRVPYATKLGALSAVGPGFLGFDHDCVAFSGSASIFPLSCGTQKLWTTSPDFRSIRTGVPVGTSVSLAVSML
jgi:hypothetical protein